MKKLLFLFSAIILGAGSLFSQSNGINVGFNYTHAGRNVGVGYSRSFKNNDRLSVGLLCYINKQSMPDDQNSVYYRRLHAQTFWQHLGFQASYDNSFLNSLEYIHPSACYDRQLAYAPTLNKGYHQGVPFEDSFGPFLWMENSLGLGFSADIYKSLYLFEKMGATFAVMFGEEQKLVKVKPEWEFGYMFNVGIGYRF